MAAWRKGISRRGYVLYVLIVSAMTLAIAVYHAFRVTSPGDVPWFAYFMLPGSALCVVVPGCIHGIEDPAQLVVVAILNILAYAGGPLLVARIAGWWRRRKPPPGGSGTLPV